MTKPLMLDTTGELAGLVEKVIQDTPEFVALTSLNFLFTWYVGEEPEKDQERRYVAAMMRKLPVRERDLYGKDVELRVNQEMWQRCPKRVHYRRVWHELCHLSVHLDENLQIKLDQEKRVMFSLVAHDVVIKTFASELEKFGLAEDLAYPSKVVAHAYREYRKKRRSA